MNIAILGFGLEGKAAYEHWKDKGSLTICDQDAIEVPEGAQTQIGNNYLANLSHFDIIVRSPAIKPQDIAKANGGDAVLAKVTSNTNEFFKVSPSKNIIAITGTKGKGTTSTLIAKLLEASGKRALIGGNIGVPPLELLKQNIKAEDWVVLELSSFQLIDFHNAPHIAICLMLVPEHLDWHININDYFDAKSQLFRYQSPDDIAIYFAENANSKQIASVGEGRKIPYLEQPGAIIKNGFISIAEQNICQVSELRLVGQHNWQNVCAAVTAVWQITNNVEAMRSVLTTFAGLPNRLELIKQVGQVRYFNDSFASTPDAAIAALDAITGWKVMIMGGFDRNLQISHLAKALLAHNGELRKVILIGQSAARVARECDQIGFTNYEVIEAATMPAIVKRAQEFAQPNDAVVLSPGFASFDMFKNFEERGLKFKEAVEQL